MSEPGRSVPLAAVTGGLLLGGSTTFLLNLTRGLRDAGHDLPVISLSRENEHHEDFTALRSDVRTVPPGRIYEDRLLWAYQQLAAVRPRAVLACLSAESFEPLRVVPRGVVRVGIIQADLPLVYEMAARFAPWIDIIVGVSHEVCEKLRGMPEFSSTRVEHIPYGIHFRPMTARPEKPSGAFLKVIYVGRVIEEQKRMSRIVEVIKRLEAAGAPMQFTIAGSGPQEAAVREQLSGCASVTLLGSVANDHVSALLREHDVFLLLSDYEGLPLSLLEAMGEGAVPVISDLPSGIRQTVPDGCGLRVPVGDIDAAAAALGQLAADRPRLAQLSRAAASHVRERFHANRMAADYLSLLPPAPGPEIEWPAMVQIPTPVGILHPCLFNGWPRRVRRLLKRLGAW